MIPSLAHFILFWNLVLFKMWRELLHLYPEVRLQVEIQYQVFNINLPYKDTKSNTTYINYCYSWNECTMKQAGIRIEQLLRCKYIYIIIYIQVFFT
jgi:hypothetical protein